MQFEFRVRDAYEVQRHLGGRMIERLMPTSLAAAATVSNRTIEQLLEDNGYQRPANVASDDALGG